MAGAKGKKEEQHNVTHVETITCVEDMPAVAADIVSQYCAQEDIDEKDIPPCVWNDIICELNIKLFTPYKYLLKTESNKYNEYNTSAILYIYNNIYKRLCNKHIQEISIKGFCDLLSISIQDIDNWSRKASTPTFNFHQKITQDNEESLFGLMRDKRINPMKILPKLNKYHTWGMPGGIVQKNIVVKDASQLPDLSSFRPQLEHNIAQPQDIEVQEE